VKFSHGRTDFHESYSTEMLLFKTVITGIFFTINNVLVYPSIDKYENYLQHWQLDCRDNFRRAPVVTQCQR